MASGSDPPLEKGSLHFHLKVDTGMNRLGVKTEEEVHHVMAILDRNPVSNAEGYLRILRQRMKRKRLFLHAV